MPGDGENNSMQGWSTEAEQDRKLLNEDLVKQLQEKPRDLLQPADENRHRAGAKYMAETPLPQVAWRSAYGGGVAYAPLSEPVSAAELHEKQMRQLEQKVHDLENLIAILHRVIGALTQK